jgi:hypothetical protein
MRTTEPEPVPGEPGLWSGAWPRHQPAPGVDRYHQDHRGVLLGWWNGAPQFAVDAATAAAIADCFADLAAYAHSSWGTVCFDGTALLVTHPPSLGGGIHRSTADLGLYRIGWGLPWRQVAAFCCDHIPGPA